MKTNLVNYDVTLKREFDKRRVEAKQCHDDSCDLSHCAKCGCHMVGGYLEHGAVCDSCTQITEWVREECTQYLFDDSDVREHGAVAGAGSLNCYKNQLVRSEPEWMRNGLQETRSGYGSRLNSGYKIRFNGRLYRIYTTCYGNAGSCWFQAKGRKIFVDAF